VISAKEFGPTFAQGLFGLKAGSWQGPIESGYGWHLVWIESIIPQRVPDLEEVSRT
jgi:parvulin-like peptidyl-prolyl isomerase